MSNNYLFLAIIIIHYIIKYFKFSNFNQLSFFLSILVLIRDWVLNNLITFLFHSHVHYFSFCCYKLYGLLNHPYNIAYVIAIHEKVSHEISMSEKWKVKNEMWKVSQCENTYLTPWTRGKTEADKWNYYYCEFRLASAFPLKCEFGLIAHWTWWVISNESSAFSHVMMQRRVLIEYR